MDSDRWKRINSIFHDALDLAPSDREGFVVAAAAGDEQLQSEVEALLRADQGAGSYLESPLLALSSEANEPPILKEGAMLCSRFRIVRKIAEGGMGRVYEATDTELGSQVAVKVIRPEIASDPAVLARFRQEVKLARRITHPNVCRTYDFERDVIVDLARDTQRDIYFLTMEYLPGETLAARIRRAGALPVEEALAIARQIADAIDTAHSLGIIHRDLKPGNLMLTSGGGGVSIGEPRAVITDFGLARVAPLSPEDDAPSMSKFQGWPIGTIAYMSPEQLQGSKVSAATDIYSFGLILFEMITGTRAFPAEAFLEGITQRIAGIGPAMEPVRVPQCWRDAIDWCIRSTAIQRPASASAVVEILIGVRNRPKIRKRIRAIWKMPSLWSTAVIFVALAAFYLFRPPASPLRMSDYQQLTRDGMMQKFLAGTDGSWLYMTGGGPTALSRVSVNGGVIQGISTKMPNTQYSDWEVSRDGSKALIQVVENEKQMGLWIAPIYGGSPTRVALGERRLSGTFASDGNSVLYLTDEGDLHLVRSNGTGDRKLTALGAGAAEARMSPDGRRIRIIKDNTLWEASADGSRLHRLFPNWHGPSIIGAGRWSFDGSIYAFEEVQPSAANQIWAIDEQRSLFNRQSYPVPLTSGPMEWDRPFPGAHGSEIYAVGRSYKGELSRVDLKAGKLRPYLGGISVDQVTFSPDGKSLAYTAYPIRVLWRASRDGSNPVQLTGESLNSVSNPRWSPNGEQILFANAPFSGTSKAYLVPAKGGSPQELLPGDNETQSDPNWSPDGKRVVLTGGNPSNTSERYIRILDVASRKLTRVPGSEGCWSPRWSRDGKYLAALSGEAPILKIFSFDTNRWLAIKTPYGVGYPNFSSDSKYLFFLMSLGGGGVYRVPVSGGHLERIARVEASDLTALWGASMSLDPADTPILTRDAGTADIYVLHVSH